MSMLEVQVRKLRDDAILPCYRHAGDAGFDLHIVEDVEIPAGGVKILPTGLAFAVPDGYEMQIRLRSGAALTTPLILPNAPATIDAGYRGEVGIIVRNLGAETFVAHKGERVAQGVIAPVIRAKLELAEVLPATERGTDGYGSTGMKGA